MPNSTDTKLNELVINETTEELLKTQEIQPNQLYVTPDEDKPSVTRTSQLVNDGDGDSPFVTEDQIAGIDVLESASKSKLGGIRLWEDSDSYLNISTVKPEIVNDLILIKKSSNTYRVDGADIDNLETINIPDTCNNLAVDEISPYAFENISSVKTITIGKNIKKMGKGAFSGCINCDTLNFNAINMDNCVNEDDAERFFITSLLYNMILSSSDHIPDGAQDEIDQLTNEERSTLTSLCLKSIGEDNYWFYNIASNTKDGLTLNIGKEVEQIPSELMSPKFATLSKVFVPVNDGTASADFGDTVRQRLQMLMYSDPDLMNYYTSGKYTALFKYFKKYSEAINIKKINWNNICKTINVGAFAFCDLPSDFKIPDSISSICSYAFLFSCSYIMNQYSSAYFIMGSSSSSYTKAPSFIDEIHLSNNIEHLGYRVFDGCPVLKLYIDNENLINYKITADLIAADGGISYLSKLFDGIDFSSMQRLCELIMTYAWAPIKMFLFQRAYSGLNAQYTSIYIPSSIELKEGASIVNGDTEYSFYVPILASIYSSAIGENGFINNYFIKQELNDYNIYCVLQKIQIINSVPDYIKITNAAGEEISEMYVTDELKIEYLQELPEDYKIYEINSNFGLGMGNLIEDKTIEDALEFLPNESYINSAIVEIVDNTYAIYYTDDIKFDMCYQDVYYEPFGSTNTTYRPGSLYSSRDSIKILDEYKGAIVDLVDESLFIPTKTYTRIEFGLNNDLRSNSESYPDPFNWDWKTYEIVLKNELQYKFFCDSKHPINSITYKVYVLKIVDDYFDDSSEKERNKDLDTNFIKTDAILDDLEYYLYTRK